MRRARGMAGSCATGGAAVCCVRRRSSPDLGRCDFLLETLHGACDCGFAGRLGKAPEPPAAGRGCLAPEAIGNFLRSLWGQLTPGLMHPPRDGGLGHPKGASRFRVGQVLPDDQHDRVPQQRVEPRQLARKPALPIGVAAVGPGGCRPAPTGAPGASPSAAPAVIATRIHHDAGEPGGESASPRKPPISSTSATDVLRDVVGIGLRAGQSPRQTATRS